MANKLRCNVYDLDRRRGYVGYSESIDFKDEKIQKLLNKCKDIPNIILRDDDFMKSYSKYIGQTQLDVVNNQEQLSNNTTEDVRNLIDTLQNEEVNHPPLNI